MRTLREGGRKGGEREGERERGREQGCVQRPFSECVCREDRSGTLQKEF